MAVAEAAVADTVVVAVATAAEVGSHFQVRSLGVSFPRLLRALSDHDVHSVFVMLRTR